VELKTLRMASNVSLRLVRDAVIAGIVNRIKIVEDGAISQRKEIASMIARWGGLIDKIGGVDPVETIELLQVCILCWLTARERLRAESFIAGALRFIRSLAPVRPNSCGSLPG